MLDPNHDLALDDVPAVAHMARLGPPYLAIAQLCLGLGIFALCLFMPCAGGAVLLIPVVPHGAMRLVDQVGVDQGHAGGITVLHAGWITGSLLVRIDGDIPILAYVHAGVVPLGAPAFLCATAISQ